MANGFPDATGVAGLWPFLHYLYDNQNSLGTPGFKGKTYFVDATNGNASATDGTSWSTAFKTMAQAFAKLASGDRVFLSGTIREQLTTPTHVFDVAVIGVGNRPRNADAVPAGGNIAANTWKVPASPALTTPLVKVIHQGWAFINILWAAPTDAPAIEITRALPADPEAELDGSHLVVYGCRFASGFGGISDTGGCVNVLVKNNMFRSLTGYCILGVGNIGVGQSYWTIEDNIFNGFTNGIKIAAFLSVVQRNTFTDGGTPTSTYVLNVSNGGGSDNHIINNTFQTLTANFATPDIVGNATDVWTLNCAFNTAAAGTSGIYEVGQPA